MWLAVNYLFYCKTVLVVSRMPQKTISDVVHPKSSLMIFLMEIKTGGRFSNHVRELFLPVSAALSCR